MSHFIAFTLKKRMEPFSLQKIKETLPLFIEKLWLRIQRIKSPP